MGKRLIYAVLLGLCLISISAFSYPSSIQKASGNHCVQQITSVPSGQRSSKRLSFACYNTFAEAIAIATGGRLHLSSEARPQDLTQAMLPPYRPNTPNVIGIDWKDANFQG